MAISCEPADLAENAKCLCFPKDVEGAVIIYLLKTLAANTMTAAQLVEEAKPYFGMPEDVKQAAMLYLTCEIANLP